MKIVVKNWECDPDLAKRLKYSPKHLFGNVEMQ